MGTVASISAGPGRVRIFSRRADRFIADCGHPPDTMTRLPFRRVSDQELRRLYNEHYASRIDAGELRSYVEFEGHPSPTRSHEPPCTRSQYVSFCEHDGTRRVDVHQYLRPNGQLGGSGRPDPKWIFHDGVIYAQQPRMA